jgi:heme exporter protein D
MNEFLAMGWPAAVVFIVFLMSIVAIYSIRRTANTTDKRIASPVQPPLKQIEHDNY